MSITSIRRFGVLQEMLTSTSSRNKIFAAPAFKSKLLEELDRLLARPANVLSLNVFDTLLLRDNPSELTRFFEIGGRMASVLNKKFGTIGLGVPVLGKFFSGIFGAHSSWALRPTSSG